MFEFVNPNAFQLNFRFYYGKTTKSDSEWSSATTMIGDAIPPQTASLLTNRPFRELFAQLHGRKYMRLGPGGRTKLTLGAFFGLRRLERDSTSDRLMNFCFFLHIWPELCFPADVYTDTNNPTLAYPNIQWTSWSQRSFYNVSYPEDMGYQQDFDSTTYQNLGDLLNAVEVKSVDNMVAANT